MRFFIEIAYNGSAYHGWQKQPDAVSVQAVLEKALSTALQQPVETVGAGRTDTGVHATQFFAHFDADISVDVQQLIFKLNTLLPWDIAVFNIFEAPFDAHARFNATGREYRYYVATRKDPFNAHSAYYIKKKIDVDQMNKAARILLEYEDFKAFSKVKTEVKTYRCHLEYAMWEKEGDELVFKIKADRFLRNMVRAIVGTLLDVGTGKIKPADMHGIVDKRDRGNAGKSAPAHALFLTQVEYPNSIYKN